MSVGQVLYNPNGRAKVRSTTLIAELRSQQLLLSLKLLYLTGFESCSGDAGSSFLALTHILNFHSSAIMLVSPLIIIMRTDSVIVSMYTRTVSVLGLIS